MRPSPIETTRTGHSLNGVARRADINLYGTAGSVVARGPLPSHGHFDRSPALQLHLDDGIWHCFGCGQTADVGEFVVPERRCGVAPGDPHSRRDLSARTRLNRVRIAERGPAELLAFTMVKGGRPFTRSRPTPWPAAGQHCVHADVPSEEWIRAV